MVLLGEGPFLNELGRMYEKNKDKGTVFVTMKRSSLRVGKAKKGADPESEDNVCLIRATDGKKKISARLTAKESVRFQASYTTILKAHMDSLKKRERKDKKR
mmetsp:Transcript_49357/g.158032  ORF Transcript_49357/g.158032 Transcript_49357/m.158032 type:complete len:102 (-) Transcript_49357:152-457(-)|eukprot:CAMPEP_0182912530 /NCGR_PEP_ID=MMETSP0034_2-20130328/37563_1 /TAXON_ID=156128 /ORGANISM="Nephroselmis pyriformis, Strain CCMP717" /LENGTH=101 /DNA_ID=CAMNT_0025049205 /DNA_START=146 /DNA_END=451 /DNA_ORIENTATION=+